MGPACQERRELERRILACVSELAHFSRKVSTTARSGRMSPDVYSSDLAQFAQLKTQLATLRECLEIHKDTHGCGY